MLSISKESKTRPEQIIQKAVEFFGPGGVGLEIMEQGDACAFFQGGGGHVFVQVCPKGKGSEVDVATREWEYQAKEFLNKV